jgi:hypothetical protein
VICLGLAVNLSEQQKDILRLLVSMDTSTGGTSFNLVELHGVARLCYPYGESPPGEYQESDFKQLRRERLITLDWIQRGVHHGKPTHLGIELVQGGFAPPDAEPVLSLQARALEESHGFPRRPAVTMREYEHRCPLLSEKALSRLELRGKNREKDISSHLESAAERVRELDGQAADTAVQRKVAALRRETIEVATTAGVEGVREFGDGLLLSQGRLGPHSTLLREYTARLANEIRHRLDQSELFRMERLLPWEQDPIAQKAIWACEELIAKYKTIEEHRSSQQQRFKGGPADQPTHEPKVWSAVVQSWEALKWTKKQITEGIERISESDLRTIVGSQRGADPEDVTWPEIEHAASELCDHYGRLQIKPSVPTEYQPTADEPQRARPILDPAFWKEREDEFRKHETSQNVELTAYWLSLSNDWRFHTLRGRSSPSVESLQLFKSLAREAAKGLDINQGAESWIDWLDLLREAKDKDTGQLLYAKLSRGSSVVSEREFDRMIRFGEFVPSGSVIEFTLATDGTIAKGRYWDTSSATIESLFRKSANLCLELRSLAPNAIPCVADGALAEARNSAPATPGEDRSPDARRGTGARKESRRVLNSSLINDWMASDDWTNETLAQKLHISERAVSSLRNDGSYHGKDAITKLANLMGRDPEDLYLPEASS